MSMLFAVINNCKDQFHVFLRQTETIHDQPDCNNDLTLVLTDEHSVIPFFLSPESRPLNRVLLV